MIDFVTYQPIKERDLNFKSSLYDPVDISEWAQGILESKDQYGNTRYIPLAKKNEIMTLDRETGEYVPRQEQEEVQQETPQEQKEVTLQQTPKFKSKNEWATALADAYRKLGVSENGIRNLITKNSLESNWGKSAQGKFNYGNITTGSSWRGSYVNGRDHDANGKPIKSKFRSYSSIEDFAKDELDFLTRLYDFNDTDSIDLFADKLKGKNKGRRHYAEAKNYKEALKARYKQI